MSLTHIRVIALLMIVGGFASPLEAQTQNLVVAPPLASCNLEDAVQKNPAALTAGQAQTLIKETIPGGYDRTHHYILHVLRLNPNGVEQDAWYALHKDRLDRTRLFGASRVTLVAAVIGGDEMSGKALIYTAVITKKRPAPLQNLLDAAKFSLMGVAADRIAKTPLVCGAAVLTVNLLPSDMKLTAATATADGPKELATMTFDNERTYAVDISFALPLKSHNDLSFSVDDGVATAKKVEKTDLFAVVNIGWPRDTKRMKFATPTLLYGMPITGKPLKKQLVAVGVGYSKVQFFVGGLFTRREVAAASEANDVVTLVVTPEVEKKWDQQFVWGVNLSVRFVTDLFKD